MENLCASVVECACLVRSRGDGKQVIYNYRHYINLSRNQSIKHLSIKALTVVYVTSFQVHHPTLLPGLGLGFSANRSTAQPI